MSYKEWIGSFGCLNREWRNEAGKLHKEGGPAHIIYEVDGSIDCEIFYINDYVSRADGPAYISYFRDGSIYFEEFWIDGDCLGQNEDGFWGLWEKLTEEGRNNHNLLRCLARFS